jgi:lipopolysaccharide biosynthesis regulator YciM
MKVFCLKIWSVCLALPLLIVSHSLRAEKIPPALDLPYGAALYQLFQNKTLNALTEIEVGNFKNAFKAQPKDAELLRGSLYFNYGLSDDAEQIFNQLLQQEKSTTTQERIWFNLARLQLEQGNFEQAEQLLSRISNPLPAQREQQRQYLLSSLFTRKQNFEQAANAIQKIDPRSIWRAYAIYNLSVAQITAGQEELGYQGLESLLKLGIAGDEFAGLLDSSQLALGLNSLRHEEYDAAIAHFLKIRFSGPVSNKALLGIGWAWSQKSDLDKAIGYWRALQKKTQIDGATLESYLAIPYALELKQRKTQAIEYYRQAAANFDKLLLEQQNLISQISEDQLIDALIQHRIIEGSSINLIAEKPLEKNTPNYLYTLIADKQFQQQLRSYQELLDILDALLKWDENVPVLTLMLKERRANFEAKRPAIENSAELERINELQSQVEQLSQKVTSIVNEENYLALADANETEYLQQLDELKSILDQLEGQQDLSAEKAKYRLLKGLLQYQIETDFPTRAWRATSELKSLRQSMKETSAAAQSLSLASAVNDNTLSELDKRIAGQSSVISQLFTQVDNLLNRQKNYINELAINTLLLQQDHIKQLRLSARYSLARLYDDVANSEKKND